MALVLSLEYFESIALLEIQLPSPDSGIQEEYKVFIRFKENYADLYSKHVIISLDSPTKFLLRRKLCPRSECPVAE